MAKKKEEMEIEIESRVPVAMETKTSIPKLSVDFGREDLNTIARKVNEIIDSM